MALSLLPVIGLALILVNQSALSSFPDRELDCSGVTEEIPLEQYKFVCYLVDKWDPEEFDELRSKTPMKRWDMLEKCTCNLLHHPLAWESLMTHEVETIYYVARKLIDLEDAKISPEARKQDSTMVTKDNLIFENDQGDVMYFWDRFSALLLNTKAGETAGRDLSKEFTDLYTDVYYKPESYKILFKGQGETLNFRQDLSGACNQLFESFGPFLIYFNNLRLLSENPRFVYRIVAYDENLYKLMGSLKMCQYLTLSGVVIKS